MSIYIHKECIKTKILTSAFTSSIWKTQFSTCSVDSETKSFWCLPRCWEVCRFVCLRLVSNRVTVLFFPSMDCFWKRTRLDAHNYIQWNSCKGIRHICIHQIKAHPLLFKGIVYLQHRGENPCVTLHTLRPKSTKSYEHDQSDEVNKAVHQ